MRVTATITLTYTYNVPSEFQWNEETGEVYPTSVVESNEEERLRKDPATLLEEYDSISISIKAAS